MYCAWCLSETLEFFQFVDVPGVVLVVYYCDEHKAEIERWAEKGMMKPRARQDILAGGSHE